MRPGRKRHGEGLMPTLGPDVHFRKSFEKYAPPVRREKYRPAGSCRLAQTLRPLRASENFEISGARKPKSLKKRALRAPRRPP